MPKIQKKSILEVKSGLSLFFVASKASRCFLNKLLIEKHQKVDLRGFQVMKDFEFLEIDR